MEFSLFYVYVNIKINDAKREAHRHEAAAGSCSKEHRHKVPFRSNKQHVH
jgi:hypothetical protein